MGGEADLVKPRFERGCRCFAVILDHAIAGYGWLSTGPEWIGELQLEIRPRKGEAYIWNCATVPIHRLKGVFRSVVDGVAGAAQREGLRRLWIGSMAIPAERALGASGFRPALRFSVLSAAGIRFLRVSASGEDALRADAERVLGVEAGAYLRRSRRVRH